MDKHTYGEGSLFGPSGSRKYLNARELDRFERAVREFPAEVRLFCLLLRWTGARISELLALVPAAFDVDTRVVSIVTLKRRKRGVVRQIPVPSWLIAEFSRVFRLRAVQNDPYCANQRLWGWSRTSAWRYVKAVMGKAYITGAQAMPKGLRHGFGVSAIQAKVPLTLLQRWLGHASLRSTAVYLDVASAEERQIAQRMWKRGHKSRDR